MLISAGNSHVLLVCALSTGLGAVVGGCQRGEHAHGAGEIDTDGDDLTPPRVEEVYPEDGAEAVAVETQIRARFSEDLRAETIDASSFSVDGIVGTVAWNPDDLTATFTAQAALDPLTSYTATLGVGIEDVAGNPLEAPVTWQFSTGTAGTKVSGDTPAIYSGEAGEPAIAFDDAGHGLAVWPAFTGSDSELVAATYDPEQGTWTELSLGRGGFYPLVASDGSGFMVAWRQIDTPLLLAGLGQRSLRARHHDGTAFGPELVVEDGADSLSSATLTGGPAGYAVVWTDQQAPNETVRASVYAGDAWSSPATLHTATSAGATAIAASASGFGAAWIQEDGGSGKAFIGTWDGAAWTVGGATTLAGYASSPTIASNGTEYAVAWVQHGPNDDLYGVVGGSGTWPSPALLESGTGSVDAPAIVVNGSDFAVGWIQDDAGERRAFSSLHQGGWAAASMISPVGEQVDRFALASNGTGYAMSWAGRAGASSIVRAAVHDGAWSDPDLLSSGNEDAGFPTLASDGSSYTATWQQFDPGSTTTFSVHTRSFEGGSWGDEQRLDTSDELMFPGTVLSGGASGYAALWLQWSGRAFDITAAIREVGEWKAPQVASGEVRHGSVMRGEVELARSNAGVVVAAWTQVDASPQSLEVQALTSVFVSSLDAGSWSTPERVGVGGRTPTVASDGTGFVVAWIADDGGDKSVYAVESDDGSDWSGPALLETAAGDAADPVVVSNGDTYMAAWLHEEPSPATVMASLHDAGGWTVAFPVGSGGLAAYAPRLASNGSGYAVTWNEHSGTEYDVYVNRWDGGGFVGPVQLDTGLDPAWWPTLGSDGDGYAVVWHENALGHSDVYASRWSGAAWSPAVLLDNDPESVDDLLVSSNGSGYAAAWHRGPSAGVSVFDGGSWGAAHDVDPEADTVLETALASDGAAYALGWTRIIGSEVHTRMATWTGGSWDVASSLDGLETHGGYAVTPRIVATGSGSWLTTRLQTHPASSPTLELWAEPRP